jgi:hypothetical protein
MAVAAKMAGRILCIDVPFVVPVTHSACVHSVAEIWYFDGANAVFVATLGLVVRC